jgi:hypothetical protein
VADKLVTIAEFSDSVRASLAQQLLADFGIEAVITGQNAAGLYGVPAISSELQVHESQAQQARKILESGGKQEG